MHLTLLSRTTLAGIPSASGIELYNNRHYIIGDDSAWLFILDATLQPVERIPLLKATKLSDAPIEKKKKPDFEAMTFARINNEDVLFIFGSGSKPRKRDKLVIVFLARKHATKRISLETLYAVLREKEMPAGYNLNIEAAAADSTTLYLFHRGNISGSNIVFSFSLAAFAGYVINEASTLPSYSLAEYELPQINGIPSGFSGAALLDKDNILFSSSVEDTDNEIDDGSVAGSFIGLLNLTSGKTEYTLLKENDKPLLLKVESICVKHSQANTHTLLAVTDSDGGASELLELELRE